MTKDDILAWWREQPFDLAIDGHLSNCDLCFLKGKGQLLHILRGNPALADWWIAQEAKHGGHVNRRGEPALRYFRDRPYSELKEEALRTPDLFVEPDATAGIDCFCTD